MTTPHDYIVQWLSAVTDSHHRPDLVRQWQMMSMMAATTRSHLNLRSDAAATIPTRLLPLDLLLADWPQLRQPHRLEQRHVVDIVLATLEARSER